MFLDAENKAEFEKLKKDLTRDTLIELVFFTGFFVIIVIRELMQIFLIVKWRNRKIDPTYIESKIGFY